MSKFAVDDRVRVSSDFFWAKGALGTIAAPPPQVLAISGPWLDGLTWQSKGALGEATVYWVWFDEPQFDADGPYRGGQIHEDAMALISN